MTLMMWRLIWAAALKLRLWSVLAMRCDGRHPAQCWIPPSAPGAADGYYRGGILAQYCQLPRGHEHPLCLARIDELGNTVHGGSRFIPEPAEEVSA
jgi:hypothetical protein